MSFEEEFPNLNIKIQVDTIKYQPHYSMWTVERLLEDVQKHCLDKARVKAAIDKCEADNITAMIMREKLLEELGLE